LGYFTLSILLTTFLTILKLLQINSINLIASTINKQEQVITD